MAGAKALWVISWNGESWVCARAVAASGSELFTIEESFEVSGEAATLPARVRDAVKSARRGAVVLIDSTAQLMAREVTVPLVAEEKQAATIAGEVHRAVPFAPEEISWDAIVLDEDAIEQRLLLLAARTTDWNAARSVVETAVPGLRCETLPVALLNAWTRIDPSAGEPAVVALPLRDTSLLLFTGGETPSLRMARGGVGRGAAETLNRLRGEWTRAMAAHRRQTPAWKPEALWLLGSEAKPVPAGLETVGSLTAQTLSEEALAEALPLAHLDRIAPAHQLAIAGTLLAESGEPYHSSHLMTEAERAKAENGSTRGWLWAAVALFLVAGLIAWWPAWQKRHELESERSALRARLAPVEANAAELDLLQQAIAREQTAITGIADLARSRANWTHFLVDLQARLSSVENVWIDALEVVREAPPVEVSTESVVDEFAEPGEPTEATNALSSLVQRLHVGGRLLDPEHPLQRVSPEMRARVNDLIDGLAGSDYVLEVADKRFDPLDGGLLRFTFTLSINPERRL